MKYFSKIIIFLILFMGAVRGISQNQAEIDALSPEEIENINEMKYWVWRDRLINDFMVPGNCNGCGIIFTKRGYVPYGDPPFNISGYGYGGFDINDEGWPIGYYLAVLATEWKLLHDAGQSTAKTEIELFYELKTIDRLDNDAETYWKEHWRRNSPFEHENDYWTIIYHDNPNGFLIRDDIFDNFLSSLILPMVGWPIIILSILIQIME